MIHIYADDMLDNHVKICKIGENALEVIMESENPD